LVTIIVPLAKQLRQKDPTLSQKEAIKMASKMYRENKGSGIFDSILKGKKMATNLLGSLL
jgi:hypothetical protein